MATWNEFESGVLSNTTGGFSKTGDGQYGITLNVTEGQTQAVMVGKDYFDDNFATVLSVIGNVPDEKLNELLEAATGYPCGAIGKAGDVCFVRHSLCLAAFTVDSFVAILQRTASTAAGLKNRNFGTF